jgi:hypothetical protein
MGVTLDPGQTSRYEKEDTSYYYQATGSSGLVRTSPVPCGGKTFPELTKDRPSGEIFVMEDIDPVHGPKGTSASRLILYADGHVK